MLKISEIFYSIQGESSHAGKPCVFVRLTACNLRCSYCDTEYAFYEGVDMSIDEILAQVSQYPCRLVEITGGEPLLQEDVIPLMQALQKKKYKVMLETSGALSIENVPPGVIKVVDLKCPSSGETGKNLYSNMDYLSSTDEVKFVIGDRKDYEWAKEMVNQYGLAEKCTVLFSHTFEKLPMKDLADWIIKDGFPVRFQTQLHRHIWGANVRGV